MVQHALDFWYGSVVDVTESKREPVSHILNFEFTASFSDSIKSSQLI